MVSDFPSYLDKSPNTSQSTHAGHSQLHFFRHVCMGRNHIYVRNAKHDVYDTAPLVFSLRLVRDAHVR
jgi:hypothetical protein